MFNEPYSIVTVKYTRLVRDAFLVGANMIPLCECVWCEYLKK